MADLLARFKLVDEMSGRLERMAESGQNMVSQLERMGEAANAAFEGISGGITSATGTITSAASSLNRLQGATDTVSSSADALSDTMNDYGDAAEEATEQADQLADRIAEQEEAVLRYMQTAGELSRTIEQSCETEEKLSEAMENAAQVSEELTDSDRISAETKEELARASQEAEEAMAELTAAQQEAEAAMAEYEAALASGTDNLDELEQAAERVRDASDALDEANRRAARAADELADSTERASDEAENAVENLASVLAAAGIAAIVAEIADAFMKTSEAAAIFEVDIKKISTIADTAQVSLSQISTDIVALSMDTGIFADSLEEATYSALSASVNTANAVEFTSTASKLASGGFTSSATAVDVLTTALNAYGLEASYAERISDMLITTQNLGKTTVDELAASVGKVIPLASAYGVEMDNLSAAYAELTKGGIATAEAGTYLKSMLNELGDSGSKVTKVLLEQTGNSFSQLMKQGYSLGDIMGVLGESVNGNAGAFNELWSSSEAGIGALSLYNAGAEQFNSTLDAMKNSIGATETAYSTMTDTTTHAQEELANAANNLQISIGQNINPLIKTLYELGTTGLNQITKFSQEYPVVVKIISALGIGLGTVAVALTAVGGAAVTLPTIIPAIVSFGSAVNAALGPIGWAAMGITALVTAGTSLAIMLSDVSDETAGMTATTRAQYYDLQDLNAEYERACEEYGKTSKEALRLRYQVDDLSAAFETNRQTVEEFTTEVDALCESTLKLSDDFRNALTEINSQEIGALALIKRYEELATQAEFAVGQEKEFEAITKKLSESYPDLTEQVKTAAISVEDYVAAMERACAQQAEQQKQQQAQDTFNEALGKQAQYEEEIAKAEANLNAERKARGMYYDEQMQKWTNGWYTEDSLWANWTTELDEYNDALEKLKAAQAENNAMIERIRQEWADAAKEEAEAAEETVSWQEAVSTAYESVQEDIEKLCAAYDQAYESALESFSGQFGLFDEASMKSDEYTNATIEHAQKALDSQLAYWETYNANLETLTAYGESLTGEARENYAALLAYAQSGSEEAAGLASSMAAAIQSGDTEAIEALSNTVAEVSAQQETAAATTADFVTDFTSQMDDIELKMQETVEGMNLSGEAKDAANSTITAYADQIRAGKKGAVSAAEEVAKAVTAALSSASATVNVKVNSGGSIPGHANGTTNAESLFLAGENGPELVARPAAAYANGTTNSTDYFIAGENGPELIAGQQGSTVFPTQETDRLISALNEKQRPLQIFADAGTKGAAEDSQTTEQTKHILLELSGNGAIELGGSQGVNKETILEVIYEQIKPILMNIVQSEIYEEGEQAYDY